MHRERITNYKMNALLRTSYLVIRTLSGSHFVEFELADFFLKFKNRYR